MRGNEYIKFDGYTITFGDLELLKSLGAYYTLTDINSVRRHFEAYGKPNYSTHYVITEGVRSFGKLAINLDINDIGSPEPKLLMWLGTPALMPEEEGGLSINLMATPSELRIVSSNYRTKNGVPLERKLHVNSEATIENIAYLLPIELYVFASLLQYFANIPRLVRRNA